MSIDDDRLLKPFRVRAGQPAPGSDMGGWYDQSADFHIDPKNWGAANWHGFIPGHSFGQYLSGLARGFAMTGDQTTRTKVARLVSQYALTISPRFFADYNLPAYTYDKLVVGLIDAFLYTSKVTAALGGAEMTVTQATTYPLSNQVQLRIDGAHPTSCEIHLRIPAWAGAGTRIQINGRIDKTPIQPGTFAALIRTWNPGDVIEITFDMGLRLEPLNRAHPETVALMSGPLVLFPVGAPETPLTRQEWLTATRKGQEEWVVAGKHAEIKLRPFMAISDQTYRLYSKLLPG